MSCSPVLAAANRPIAAPFGTVSVRDIVRVFNKYVTNPLMMRLAGRKYWYASVIRHTGRRTGKTYDTPVVAEPFTGGFIIPLPYGRHVDWLRNVRRTGTATIRHKGNVYAVAAPEIIDAATAAPLLSPPRRRQFGRFGIDEFVTFETRDARSATAGGASPPSDPGDAE
ncbi:nitroreductase/quinone reductase family protein [Nocardia higoensis]|uniref:nitroreductase/quinone reductase family protein n=1 Tax=Nocardia higoensis TaxID=228599 RepID=UPI0012F62282|nr:nitroreductase/quinone reductase family protein [Nocardia higoensis]